jgi:hypothetical protein
MASTNSLPLSLTTIIGISAGALVLLLIILYSCTTCRTRKILTHTVAM